MRSLTAETRAENARPLKGTARAVRSRFAGCVCAHQIETQRELSEHDFVHHRPKPDWRHRANPCPRCGRAEEAHYPLCL